MTFWRKYHGDRLRAELRFCSQCGVKMLAAEVPILAVVMALYIVVALVGCGGESPDTPAAELAMRDLGTDVADEVVLTYKDRLVTLHERTGSGYQEIADITIEEAQRMGGSCGQVLSMMVIYSSWKKAADYRSLCEKALR